MIIDNPALENEFMASRGLTRSRQRPATMNLMSQEAISTCPVKGVFDHEILYDQNGKPNSLVSQPYKSRITLTDEEIQLLNNWCEAHGWGLIVNQWDSYYYPERCHVVEFRKRKRQ